MFCGGGDDSIFCGEPRWPDFGEDIKWHEFSTGLEEGVYEHVWCLKEDYLKRRSDVLMEWRDSDGYKNLFSELGDDGHLWRGQGDN